MYLHCVYTKRSWSLLVLASGKSSNVNCLYVKPSSSTGSINATLCAISSPSLTSSYRFCTSATVCLLVELKECFSRTGILTDSSPDCV